MNPVDRNRLLELISQLSYKEGDFTLASGKNSSFYIDLKNTTLHPEGASLVGCLGAQCLGEAIKKLRIEIDGVGGLTLGADPIATSVSIMAFKNGFIWPAFIVRKEIKKHGTTRAIEGIQNLKSGATVVVVEDVVTTGGSSEIAILSLREAGFKIACVFTIVDREAGGELKFKSLGVPLLSLFRLTEIQDFYSKMSK